MSGAIRAALSGLAFSLPIAALLAVRVAMPFAHAGAARPIDAPLPTPTAAFLQLDQEQSVVTGGLSVRASAAQTITVGIAGSLVRVDLPLCSPSKNSRIELAVSDTGMKAQSATASIIFQHSYSDCNWYTFIFNQPITATAGEALRLTVQARNQKAGLWGEDGHLGDPYPRGVGSWRGHIINDFAFRTYMQ